VGRSWIAVLAVVLALGVGLWMRIERREGVRIRTEEAHSVSESETATTGTGATGQGPSPVAQSTAVPDVPVERTASSVREPTAAAAEASEARAIDELVAANRIGEAHHEAMLFVQRHPGGPYTAHVMNLMGVHPRPPGAVPDSTQDR
jgi:hypothetical protein